MDPFTLEAQVVIDGFVCLMGRNGSGKTSLINTLAGFYKVDSGRIVVNGVDVTRLEAYRRGIVVVNHNSFLPHMDVDDHLVYGLKVRGLRVNVDEVQIVKSALGVDYRGKVGKLSLGMKMRVALATAILSRPSGILVDEVFSNLHNPLEALKEYKKLSGDRGIDVLYTTQSKEEGEVAETLYLIEGGKTKLLRSNKNHG
ncbi:MAG: ATP-binding cassette domain-containing protein [Thermoprotei archaeon]